jgi:hypothetical protein
MTHEDIELGRVSFKAARGKEYFGIKKGGVSPKSERSSCSSVDLESI